MTRPKLGDRRLLPIELARESVDLAATGQGEAPRHAAETAAHPHSSSSMRYGRAAGASPGR
ncbi:hypothetical protein ACVOMS_35130 (plasmid) [Bradyrhizobium guangxiense]